ncbi:KEOPS complex subunit Bud32 [Candidatus Tiddalikarchaeum anstoanum]|nr:KEOPS complex subunit Bud32 [Candidatus Tiddalikarchaeum anstoanum]
MILLSQGAEAKIYEVNKDTLLKERVKKNYRLTEIDEYLRKTRTKNEVSLLKRAKSVGVSVPNVYDLEKYSFKMDYIKGIVLRDYIPKIDEKRLVQIFKIVGKQINLLHKENIVHGDLTTSNMIVDGDKVYFIDFSLGSVSSKIEDKAVDLHLIKQALIAKHNNVWEKCMKIIISSYKNKLVIERLKSVEKRGRKKQ